MKKNLKKVEITKAELRDLMAIRNAAKRTQEAHDRQCGENCDCVTCAAITSYYRRAAAR